MTLPFRGGKGTSCQREAKSLPYDGSQGGDDLLKLLQTGAKNDVAENTTSFCISSPAALAAAAIAAAFLLFGAEQQPCHVSADGSQQRIVPEAHPIHPPI